MKKIFLKDSYTLDDLFDILTALRGENGCPWDKIQTHESLKKCLIEEAYETIDALDSGDDKMFANELGDVLLQVAFHSQLAAERSAFNFDDVLYELCTKLITRHTHVFGDVSAKDPEAALANWEKNKNKELENLNPYEVMKAVPHHLPALMRAEKIQKKAESFGANVPSEKEIKESIKNLISTDEFSECDYKKLLFSVVALGRAKGISPETELIAETNKFLDNCKNKQNLKEVTI